MIYFEQTKAQEQIHTGPKETPIAPISPEDFVTLRSSVEIDNLSLDSFYNLPIEKRCQIILGSENLTYGAEYISNFPNKTLLKHIGLADLLKPEVREVQVNGTTYTREANGGFFDSNGKYLPIKNGTKFSITKIDESYQIPKINFKTQTPEQKETSDQVEKPKHVQIAENYNICPTTLKTISSLLPNENLNLLARYIQNTTINFEKNISNGKLLNETKDEYSDDFLIYLYPRLNLFSSFNYQKENTLSFIKAYKKAQGREFSEQDFNTTFERFTPELPEIEIKSFPELNSKGTEIQRKKLEESCRKYNLDYATIYRLINYESGWNPNAQNPNSSASGLGQFLDSTWESVKKQFGSNFNKLNPLHSIEATCWNIRNTIDSNQFYKKYEKENPNKKGILYYAIHHEGTAGGAMFLRFLNAFQKGEKFTYQNFEKHKGFLYDKTAAKGLEHVLAVYKAALICNGPK